MICLVLENLLIVVQGNSGMERTGHGQINHCCVEQQELRAALEAELAGSRLVAKEQTRELDELRRSSQENEEVKSGLATALDNSCDTARQQSLEIDQLRVALQKEEQKVAVTLRFADADITKLEAENECLKSEASEREQWITKTFAVAKDATDNLLRDKANLEKERDHLAEAAAKNQLDAEMTRNRLHNLNYALEGNLPVGFDTKATLAIKEEAIKDLEQRLSDLQEQHDHSEKANSDLNVANDKLIGALRQKVESQESQLAFLEHRVQFYSEANDSFLRRDFQKDRTYDLQDVIDGARHQVQAATQDRNLAHAQMVSLQDHYDMTVKNLQQSLEEERIAKENLFRQLMKIKEDLLKASSKNLELDLEIEPIKKELEEQKLATQAAKQDLEALNRRQDELEKMGWEEQFVKALKEKEEVIAQSRAQLRQLRKENNELLEVEWVRQEAAKHEVAVSAHHEWVWDQLTERLHFAEAQLAKLPENPMLKFVTDPRDWRCEDAASNQHNDAEDSNSREETSCRPILPSDGGFSPRDAVNDHPSTPTQRYIETREENTLTPRGNAFAITVPNGFSSQPEFYGPGDRKGKGKMVYDSVSYHNYESVYESLMKPWPTPPETPVSNRCPVPHGLS